MLHINAITTWKAGLRSHSFRAVFALGLMLIGVAYLSALLSPRQPQTVALDVGFSGIRFSLILLVLFWIQDLVGKEIENRTALLFLAHPVPRWTYLIGRFLGVVLLTLAAGVILGLCLWIVSMSAGGDYEQANMVAIGLPYWFCMLGVCLNIMVVASFTLLIAAVSTSSMMPLALGAMFAISGQSVGAVLEYLHGNEALENHPIVSGYVSTVIDISKLVLPDLSQLDWRAWPMYGQATAIQHAGLSSLMALCYIGITLSGAVYFFNRREFNS